MHPRNSPFPCHRIFHVSEGVEEDLLLAHLTIFSRIESSGGREIEGMRWPFPDGGIGCPSDGELEGRGTG